MGRPELLHREVAVCKEVLAFRGTTRSISVEMKISKRPRQLGPTDVVDDEGGAQTTA